MDYNNTLTPTDLLLNQHCDRIIEFHKKYIFKDQFLSIKKMMTEQGRYNQLPCTKLVIETEIQTENKSSNSYFTLGCLCSNDTFKSNIVLTDKKRLIGTQGLYLAEFMYINFDKSYTKACIKIHFHVKNYLLEILTDPRGEFYFIIWGASKTIIQLAIDEVPSDYCQELGKGYLDMNINDAPLTEKQTMDKIYQLINCFFDLINTNNSSSFTQFIGEVKSQELSKWMRLVEISNI